MTEKELSYYIGFMRTGFFGPVRLGLVEKFFGTFERAWNGSSQELQKAGIEKNLAELFFEKKKIIDPEDEIALLKNSKTLWCEIHSEKYPALLKEIPNAPKILFYRGEILKFSLPLSIVGTRKVTDYGKEVKKTLARDLAQFGCEIISGLAFGADSIVHEECLKAGGRTYAVLGCGVDSHTIYPRYNLSLAENIIEQGGALVSEFPPKTPALKQHFPLRNRIIAGLSRGTCVTEAPQKSGALITAKFALEYNRDVFSVPGNILSPSSEGCNKLIQLGAKAVTCADDILTEYEIFLKKKKTAHKLEITQSEKKVLDMLDSGPLDIDSIIQTSGMPAREVLTALSLLEIKGAAKFLGNKTYIKSKI